VPLAGGRTVRYTTHSDTPPMIAPTTTSLAWCMPRYMRENPTIGGSTIAAVSATPRATRERVCHHTTTAIEP
jgi:hypothetical protein